VAGASHEARPGRTPTTSCPSRDKHRATTSSAIVTAIRNRHAPGHTFSVFVLSKRDSSQGGQRSQRYARIFRMLVATVCLAVVALTMRSFWYTDVIDWMTPAHSVELGTDFGRFFLICKNRNSSWGTDVNYSATRRRHYGVAWWPDLGECDERYNLVICSIGIDHYAAGSVYAPGIKKWVVVIPLWSILAIASILPLLRLWQLYRRRTRKIRGLCVNCGYDLRGSLACCPECGTSQTT
jgi:hypothetical protein